MSTAESKKADYLRKRAEALLAISSEALRPDDLKSVNELAQELAIHQAELELQNEELREAQAALQESRDRFAVLFEHAPVGYVVLDASGIIRQTNATWLAMLKSENDDFRGAPFTSTMVVEDAPIFLARFRAFFRNPAEKQIVIRMKRKDGASFHARIEAASRELRFKDSAATDASNRELMVTVSDISDLVRAEEERLQLEQRLHQTQKAESLGRMAGAIAHNFNNMLGAIMGNLEMALDEAPYGSELDNSIREAMKASQRASKISRFMLTYLGQTTGKLEPVDPSVAIREACSLLSSSLPGNVHLKAVTPSCGLTIKADGAHLTQILTILIANAIEAIGEKPGDIDLTLDVVPASSVRGSKIFPLGWEPKAQEYVCISIADTGCGIDPKHFDKIFDPFFTTKFAGRGLGLSVVTGLLRALEGAISVESRPGSGATFKLYLPVSGQAQPEARRDEAPVGSPFKENGLVLVVDDESMVRSMAETMLKRKLGFEAITAADGKEALEIFRERKDEISLILLDLSMPGMNGWETLAALRLLRPDIPVILSSGYNEAQMTRAEHLERPQAFLPKPYGAMELKTAVEAASHANSPSDPEPREGVTA